jgi:hypothetical protein
LGKNIKEKRENMNEKAEIFKKHYEQYCTQIDEADLEAAAEILGGRKEGARLRVSFFGREFLVGQGAISDESGARPDYMTCVILAKYVLRCPSRIHHEPEWVSFKDFKKESSFTNVNFFSSDVERAVAGRFSGRLSALERTCRESGGSLCPMDVSYDVSYRFEALPRLSLLLLFNDEDEDFPAKCMVLFQKHAEEYLDPESLAMTGAILIKNLKTIDKV